VRRSDSDDAGAHDSAMGFIRIIALCVVLIDGAAFAATSATALPADTAAALAAQPARLAARLAALPPHAAAAETFVLAVGGNGFQAIFDREARRAADVLARRGGGPALVLSNSADQLSNGLVASPRTVERAVAAIGMRYRSGDTLIVYLASHGGRRGIIAMDAPGLDFAPLSVETLARALRRAAIDRRIVIVSACFGASWIAPLASPTTIVVAAAAADRTSFGCDDSRDLTFFGEAMLGELADPARSLEVSFLRAKRRIAAEEHAERFVPSLPQAFVGAAMAERWTGHSASAQ